MCFFLPEQRMRSRLGSEDLNRSWGHGRGDGLKADSHREGVMWHLIYMLPIQELCRICLIKKALSILINAIQFELVKKKKVLFTYIGADGVSSLSLYRVQLPTSGPCAHGLPLDSGVHSAAPGSEDLDIWVAALKPLTNEDGWNNTPAPHPQGVSSEVYALLAPRVPSWIKSQSFPAVTGLMTQTVLVTFSSSPPSLPYSPILLGVPHKPLPLKSLSHGVRFLGKSKLRPNP